MQSPLYRSKPKPSGGTSGACDGTYSFTLQDLIDTSPIIVAGAVINAEIWARDPANPDGFLLSDGLERDTESDLEFQISRLHRSCRRLIWLNPMLLSMIQRQ